jgi:hypothetical protein
LVERHSRFVMLVKLSAKDTHMVVQALSSSHPLSSRLMCG